MKGFDMSVTKIHITGRSPYPPGRVHLPGGEVELALPDFSRKFTEVRKVKLSFFSLQETSLDTLHWASNLESLHLFACDGLSTRCLFGLYNTPISSLNLEYSLVSSEFIGAVRQFRTATPQHPKLHSLGLSYVWSNVATRSGLTTTILKTMLGMPGLQELDISGYSNCLSSEGFQALRTFPDLQVLVMRDSNRYLVANAGKGVGFRRLTVLDVSDDFYRNGFFDDRHLSNLRGVPLNTLVMGGCQRITDEGVKFLKGFPLTDLTLDSPHITSKGILALEGLPLTRLHLTFCGVLGDEILKSFKKMPLRDLSLGYWNENRVGHTITDSGLQYLWDLPLTKLNLALCELVTVDGCLALRSHGMPLQKLVLPVHGNDGMDIAPEGLADIVQNQNDAAPSVRYISHSLVF